MKTYKSILVAVAVVLAGVSALVGLTGSGAQAIGADSVPKAQTVCPIMGGEINPKLYVDVLGKRIYVCCPGCIAEIKADPQAALKKIAENGETAQDAPAPAKR